MEILTTENLVGAKTAPTAISRKDFRSLTKENQVSLLRIHISRNQNWMENHQTLGSGRIGILK